MPDIDKSLFTKCVRIFAILREGASVHSIALVDLYSNSVVKLLKVSSKAREACLGRAVRASILVD